MRFFCFEYSQFFSYAKRQGRDFFLLQDLDNQILRTSELSAMNQ